MCRGGERPAWRAPRSGPCPVPVPPPQPRGMLAARSPPSGPVPVAAGSCTGRGSSGRVLRAGGTGGTRRSHGWGWRVVCPPPPHSGSHSPGTCWPGSCPPCPAQGRPAPGGVVPRKELGAGGGTFAEPSSAVSARKRWGTRRGGSRPVPCSRARISGRTRRCSSEERSRGSREGAESRATGGRSWRTPSLPVPAAAALGTLAPVGLPRLGLLPSARRGRAGSVSPCPIIFPILPPRRSPASPSPGAAVGPSGGCLCRTQRRASPQPGLQRSALQVFLPHPPPALPGKG